MEPFRYMLRSVVMDTNYLEAVSIIENGRYLSAKSLKFKRPAASIK